MRAICFICLLILSGEGHASSCFKTLGKLTRLYAQLTHRLSTPRSHVRSMQILEQLELIDHANLSRQRHDAIISRDTFAIDLRNMHGSLALLTPFNNNQAIVHLDNRIYRAGIVSANYPHLDDELVRPNIQIGHLRLQYQRMYDFRAKSARFPSYVNTAHFSVKEVREFPFEDKIIVATQNDGLYLINGKGLEIRARNNDGVRSFKTAVFSPFDDVISVISSDNKLKIYRATNLQELHSFDLSYNIVRMQYVKEGQDKLLKLYASDESCEVLNARTLQLVRIESWGGRTLRDENITNQGGVERQIYSEGRRIHLHYKIPVYQYLLN